MKVIVKEVGRAPREADIENTLKALQEAVGGYIEAVTMANDMVVLCDEEGLLKGKEYNCYIAGILFSGTVVFLGTKEDEFTDVPMSFEQFKKVFAPLFADKE